MQWQRRLRKPLPHPRCRPWRLRQPLQQPHWQPWTWPVCVCVWLEGVENTQAQRSADCESGRLRRRKEAGQTHWHYQPTKHNFRHTRSPQPQPWPLQQPVRWMDSRQSRQSRVTVQHRKVAVCGHTWHGTAATNTHTQALARTRIRTSAAAVASALAAASASAAAVNRH